MDEIKLLLFLLEKVRPAFPGMRHHMTLCDQGLQLTLMIGPSDYQTIIIPTHDAEVLARDDDLYQRVYSMVQRCLDSTEMFRVDR